jgi:hypothetical protein
MNARVRQARTAFVAVVIGTLLSATACSSTKSASGSDGTKLTGTFKLTPGRCTSATPTGSYFRMIDPGGTIASGKFFSNPDSTCPDKSFTVQTPGADGGLITGTYQPGPSTAFDAHGDALANRITQPGSFTAIKFGISTSASDPQTGKKVAAPEIFDNKGTLSGQVTAWSAAWNNLYFNQGSPKPGGGSPGLTAPVSGTYDSATHAYVLTWASQVVGGPFNGFTGYWHLQGTFVPSP